MREGSMRSQVIANGHFRKAIARCAGTLVLAALIALGSLIADRAAMAATGVGSAAQAADAQMAACGNNTGKALYGCVADVISKLCYQIGSANIPATVKALDAAVSRLRRAVDKIQALSALAQARIAITGAVRQARSIGHAGGGSADATDLEAISALLSHASQLIQAKG
jgi:hypothetical protein